MRRSKTAAKPIKIAPSESRKVTSHDSSDVLTNGGNEFIIANNRCDELNSGMGAMTVGSLPSVRRGRRSVVTSGGNERLFGGHAGSGNHWGQNQRRGNGRPDNEILAASLPVPHAPFLSSRRDYNTGNNLSSIPAINLTRSAAGSIESDTVTYGSLRESTFTCLNTNKAYISESTANKSNISDKSSEFTPLSLPQMRIRNEKKRHSYGIGTFLQSESHGGIASLFDGVDSTSIQPGNEIPPYQEGIGNCDIENPSPHAIGHTEAIDPGELKGNSIEHKRAGLVLDDRGQVPNEVNSLDISDDIPSGSRLGTSLTGMDILKSSQPGLVDLTPEQRECLQQRVRVMGSYDGPVSPSFSSDVTPVLSRTPPNHLHSRTKDFHTQVFRETDSRQNLFLIPPRDMILAHETEDSDGYDNRPPDDDIFDMDE